MSDGALSRDWCGSVREQTTSYIDDMITRLQNIKHTIALECAKTNHAMANYVTLCEDAIKAADSIGQAVSRMEQNSITSAAPTPPKLEASDAQH